MNFMFEMILFGELKLLKVHKFNDDTVVTFKPDHSVINSKARK